MAVLHASDMSDGIAHHFMLAITYHLPSERICIHKIPTDRFAELLCLSSVDENLLYWIKNEGDKRSIWISNLCAEPPLYAARNMSLGLPSDPADEVFRVVKGDNQILSIIDATGVQVWSFADANQR